MYKIRPFSWLFWFLFDIGNLSNNNTLMKICYHLETILQIEENMFISGTELFDELGLFKKKIIYKGTSSLHFLQNS